MGGPGDGIVEPVPVQRIESPCINVCVMDEARGLCLGCARTIDEIGGWSSGSAEWRNAVMAALPERMAGLDL